MMTDFLNLNTDFIINKTFNSVFRQMLWFQNGCTDLAVKGKSPIPLLFSILYEVEDCIVGFSISWFPSLRMLNLLMQAKGITDLGV